MPKMTSPGHRTQPTDSANLYGGPCCTADPVLGDGDGEQNRPKPLPKEHGLTKKRHKKRAKIVLLVLL